MKKSAFVRMECPGCGRKIVVKGQEESCLYCGTSIQRSQIERRGIIVEPQSVIDEAVSTPTEEEEPENR